MNKQLTGRKIDPQGSDAAHSWKKTAVKRSLKSFSVAHSREVFSGMLHKIPRSGLAVSAVTVAYALNAFELVPFEGLELQVCAWY
jgi:hypothetical protein